jgi:hypothetical protein
MNKVVSGGAWLALSLSLLAGAPLCQAQDASSLLHSITDRVTQKVVDRIANPATPAPAPTPSDRQARHAMPRVDGGLDFTPAPVTLYRDDFDTTANGALPHGWKTNASGQVVTVQGFDGKWLDIPGGATFKLSGMQRLPERFTIEFDLLPLAETPDDLNSPLFGFAGDNRASIYLSDGVSEGALNAIGLLFYNSGSDVTAYSGATGFNSMPDFRLQEYANRLLHVSIAVDGNRERVYLDHTKIVDSRMFQDNPSRYFFISSAMSYKHGARFLLGNFRIAGYR